MVKGRRTIIFSVVEFTDDVITVDEWCGGGGGLVHIVQVVCHINVVERLLSALTVIVLRMSSGW